MRGKKTLNSQGRKKTKTIAKYSFELLTAPHDTNPMFPPILDCPSGTFQGAGVKTVVLFFEKGKPTEKIWYYQLDVGRNLGKTNPLNDDDLAEFVEFQQSFKVSEKSWLVDIDKVDKESYDLSVKNPHAPEEESLRKPSVILEEIGALDEESAQILANIMPMVR